MYPPPATRRALRRSAENSAQRIVTAHGGTLTFERPESGGACFRVTLPLYVPQGA
jgi:signal transduction histidine kinase